MSWVKIDRCALADMDAPRIGLVQFGRKRDRALGRDIHSPYLIEIKAAQFRGVGAQLAAHGSQEPELAQVG